MSDQIPPPIEPIDPSAVTILADRLVDPAFRTAFRQDPAAAMQLFNVPALPQELVDHLAALTDEELAFIGKEATFMRQFPVMIATWL